MTERRKEGGKKRGGVKGGRVRAEDGGGGRKAGREDDTLVVTVRCHVISSSVFLAVSVSLVLHADPENSIVHKIIIIITICDCEVVFLPCQIQLVCSYMIIFLSNTVCLQSKVCNM